MTTSANSIGTEWAVEDFPLGSSRTYDSAAKCGYLHVQTCNSEGLDSFRIGETVDIGGGVFVDVDDQGLIRGIESTNGPVTMETLLLVLRHRVRFAESGANLG